MNKNKLFHRGELIEFREVTYDSVAMFYTLKAKKYKVYDYTRRSDKNYDIEVQPIWITVSLETPHVKSFYTKADQNQTQVNESEVCNAIAKEWAQYLSYGLFNRNKTWIGLQEGSWDLKRDRITKEECIDYLEIEPSKFASSDGVELFSPYQ